MSTQDNKALARRFFEEFWDQKNLAVADELMAANHVDHTPGSPPGLPPGPAGFKQFASVYFTAFPNLRITIDDQVAEGDTVVTRWTSHGTNTGSLFGNSVLSLCRGKRISNPSNPFHLRGEDRAVAKSGIPAGFLGAASP